MVPHFGFIAQSLARVLSHAPSFLSGCRANAGFRRTRPYDLQESLFQESFLQQSFMLQSNNMTLSMLAFTEGESWR